MKFSVRLPEGSDDFSPTYQQAQLAEELEFDTVYLAEHHGFPDSPYWPAPILGLAAIAARTSTINLGTNIAQLPLYNPVRLAGEIALLDVISNGRTKFGFGIGWRELEFDAFGVPTTERGRRMDEYLHVLDELLTASPASFDGEYVKFDGFELSPKPLQSPRPDFFVGGSSRQTRRRATQSAEGWVASGGSLDDMTEFVSTLREHGDPQVIIGTAGTAVRRSENDARTATVSFITNRMIPVVRAKRTHHYRDYLKHLKEKKGSGDSASPPDSETFAKNIAEYEIRNGLDEYTKTKSFIAGSPEQCIAQLENMIERFSCDEIIFRPHTAGVAVSESARTIEVLGTEVLPSF